MEFPNNWPPSNKIKPLFLSFHLNPTAKKGMLTPKGIAYFKKYQPIGCRDLYTEKCLKETGVKTYFSGCLTLGLKRSAFVAPQAKRKGIVIISPLERLLDEPQSIQWNKPKTVFKGLIRLFKHPFKQAQYKRSMQRIHAFLEGQSRKISWHSQLISTKEVSEKQRILAAEKQLQIIANAELVITSRIHSALPAVAFETPVIFLSDGLEHPNQSSRLEGMESFFSIINSKELIKFSNELPKAKKAHLSLLKRFKKETELFLRD
jgi:hypothetical protein